MARAWCRCIVGEQDGEDCDENCSLPTNIIQQHAVELKMAGPGDERRGVVHLQECGRGRLTVGQKVTRYFGGL
jgi:hypothetical protein